MEVHQLRYFCAVAKTGNFTRAAEQEHVSQPSLSHQILKLEEELGARLFDRLARKVRLNEFGKAFLPHARIVLRELGEGSATIREMSGDWGGAVRIGAIPTVAPYFLADHLRYFASAHPRIEIHVLEQITSELLAKLHDASIDLAVLALPLSGKELSCHPLLTEPLLAVVPSRHSFANFHVVRMEQIAGEPFLLLREGHCFRETAVAACRRANIRPNVVFESSHFSTILAMVAAGMGISIVPRMAVEHRPEIRFIPLADRQATRTLGVVRLRRRVQMPAHRLMLESLLERARQPMSRAAGAA